MQFLWKGIYRAFCNRASYIYSVLIDIGGTVIQKTRCQENVYASYFLHKKTHNPQEFDWDVLGKSTKKSSSTSLDTTTTFHFKIFLIGNTMLNQNLLTEKGTSSRNLKFSIKDTKNKNKK